MQQSELALFAQDFQRALGPLGEALENARERLHEGRAGLPFAPFADEELASGLTALTEELQALVQRVSRERAAVFVFGPAKGGKSTLLDALAGVRTGAASALPRHPSLLRVRYAEQESARLVAFDGSTTPGADPGALQLAEQRAHGELASRVRAVRAAGEAFDPARHCPGAVRRVERALAAQALAQGALELLECPPIHCPLFASYAEMLIGEPDQARAGVFVVRAGQLADDTVFDGLEELLARFERLILVLNLDEHARELAHSGELVAGPECQDPARLIASFEELTTCEPLAQALRSGSVRVLALDLLGVAHARLHGAEEGATPVRQGARFADLARELARELDEHEALRALTHSALKRAGELEQEARALAHAPGLEELARRLASAEHERAALAAALEALERLAARARTRWEGEPLFDALRTRLVARCVARADELAQALDAPCARALEDWFAGGSSLQEFLGTALEPRLLAARAELGRWAERTCREELRLTGEDGALSTGASAELGQGRVSLPALLGSCAELLRISLEPTQPARGELRVLAVESIPVERTLGQRLTGRSAADVRRALLGPPEAPAAALTSRAKAQRLGAEARRAMQRSAAERARTILADEARRAARTLSEALLSVFLAELHRHIEVERARSLAPLHALELRVAELGALSGVLSALPPACARAQVALADLAEHFAPADVLVPAPRLPRESHASLRETEPAFE